MKQLAAATAFAIAASVSPPGAAQEGAIDLGAEAREIWGDAAAKLEGSKSFTATATLAYDAVQPSGRKLQFGAEYKLKAKRPNKFFAGITGDDGRRISLYYDGEKITLVNPDQKLYASFPHEGSIESAIDEVLNTLNARMPLAALLRGNLRSVLEGIFPDSYYIGPHAVGGVSSDHVLLSNEYIDLQLWIDAGEEPAVHKAVITYTDVEAAPQYTASFTDWRFNKRIRDRDFAFEPDTGFEQIEFLEAQQ